MLNGIFLIVHGTPDHDGCIGWFRAIRFVVLAMFGVVFVAFMWKYIVAVLIILKVFSGGT